MDYRRMLPGFLDSMRCLQGVDQAGSDDLSSLSNPDKRSTIGYPRLIRSIFQIFLFFGGWVALSANGQELGQMYSELKLSNGKILPNTTVTKFDGERFQVENINGISQIDWCNMSAEWKAKFPFDSQRALRVVTFEKKAALAKQTEANREQLTKGTPTPSPVPRSQFGTIMDVPRYNLDTEISDIKIGITTEKVARILGPPRHVNRTVSRSGVHEQWCYSNYRYCYFEDGILTSFENIR